MQKSGFLSVLNPNVLGKKACTQAVSMTLEPKTRRLKQMLTPRVLQVYLSMFLFKIKLKLSKVL